MIDATLSNDPLYGATLETGVPPLPSSSVKATARRDVTLQRCPASASSSEAQWIVFDPATRQSFRVGTLEHWMLTELEVPTSADRLFARLSEQFPQSDISREQVVAAFQRLLGNQLIRLHGMLAPSKSATPSAGQPWLRLFFCQVRGLNPDRLLGRWASRFDWLFSAYAVKFWLALAAITFCLVILDFQRLSSQGSLWSWIQSPYASGGLVVVFLITRAAHELGHALVCKRFGVRCPDIGLFLILGAPCVYCDVSESWRLPFRRQRAAIAAAGMYVEVWLACMASWVWILTVDGTLNTLALQTMLICSVSTLLINLNPLMRFDGYYLVADWWDETNLRARADGFAQQMLDRWVLGPASERLNSDRSAKKKTTSYQKLLVLFSTAGLLYRLFLSVTLATVVVLIGEQWNLVWFGRAGALLLLASWWSGPMTRLFSRWWQQASSMGKKLRIGLLAAIMLLLLLMLPIPSRRVATGWIQPELTRGVFAPADGRLIACNIRDGQRVESGMKLFEIENIDLSRNVVIRNADVASARMRLVSQRRQRDMYGFDIDLAQLEGEVLTAEQQATHSVEAKQALTLRAGESGVFQASETTLLGPGLPYHWSDRELIGSVVPQGTLLGSIRSDTSLAVLPLQEHQLSDIARGTEVRLRIVKSRPMILRGQVDSVVQLTEITAGVSSQFGATSMYQTTDSTSSSNAPRQPLASANSGEQSVPRFAALVRLPQDFSGSTGSSVEAVLMTPSTTIAATVSSWLHANLRMLAD